MDSITVLDFLDIVAEEFAELLFKVCDVDLEPCEIDLAYYQEPVILSKITLGGLGRAIFLCVPEGAAELISQKFLGVDSDYGNDEMLDIMGELNNILTGVVKSSVDAQGVNFDISIPELRVVEDPGQLFNEAKRVEAQCFESTGGVLWAGIMSFTS